MKVLYIACNTAGADDLALEREITELQRRALQSSGAPAQFHFLPALSVEELPMALSNYAPDVLHFSGHGEAGYLHMANVAGSTVLVDGAMLTEFLKYERPPKLVYLNACTSSTLARTIVDCGSVTMSIGTTAPVTNRTARAAAVLFYDRILMGSSVRDAWAAGQKLMEGMQEKQVSSELYMGSGMDPSSHRLFSVPRLVARPENDRFTFDREGFIALELQLIGTPSNTLQVVFFTDDKSFICSSIRKGESEAEFLARELCHVVRDTPKRGRIVSPILWPTDEDFRIYACATTADGKAYSVSSTVCDAIEDYARYVNRSYHSEPAASALARVIGRLQDPEQSCLKSAGEPLEKLSDKLRSARPEPRTSAVAREPAAMLDTSKPTSRKPQ